MGGESKLVSLDGPFETIFGHFRAILGPFGYTWLEEMEGLQGGWGPPPRWERAKFRQVEKFAKKMGIKWNENLKNDPDEKFRFPKRPYCCQIPTEIWTLHKKKGQIFSAVLGGRGMRYCSYIHGFFES